MNDIIVKSNYIIEASYRLSLEEQRIIHILTSMIEKDDVDFKRYKFTIKEFAKIIKTKNKNIYKDMAIYIDSLRSRDLTIYKEDSVLKLKWLSSAEYFHSKGYIELEFSPKLKPYLLQLKERFTKLSRNQLISFRSQHTGRVYELLKQYENIKQRDITIKEFKSYLGLEDYEYKLYSEIKRSIVTRAIKEINQNSDINVDYKEIKEGRKVVALKFFIDPKIKEKEISIKENNDFDIIKVMEIMDNLIGEKEATSIYNKSGKNLDKIRMAYNVCKDKDVDNLVGYMISLVSLDEISEPIKKKKIKKANFEQRNYTPEYFKELERKLLGWDDEEDENEDEYEEELLETY